jgi:cardiolipin synthase
VVGRANHLPTAAHNPPQTVLPPDENADAEPPWMHVRRPTFSGGNAVTLLRGGDALFPAMVERIDVAEREVWLATYIFHSEHGGQGLVDALVRAARRGVKVRVVLDGFGCKGHVAALFAQLATAGVEMAVFRPLDRWWHWLKPGQLRRLHLKLCVVDSEVGFTGGINLIDDRYDVSHGWTDQPRLDYAAQVTGPAVQAMRHATVAVWTRAHWGDALREELKALARSAQPLARARRVVQQLRLSPRGHQQAADAPLAPMQAAFVLRDNVRQRRTIERAYIDAIRRSRQRVDLMSPYFYPGRTFRRELRAAARRGVVVRLLLQGKLDYRIAGLAARALYDELLGAGVRIYEYTPAYLHAKVAVIDDDWATVGSSNIDPLSLLLNLEGNLIVRDVDFSACLLQQFDEALAASAEIDPSQKYRPGLLGALRRAVVAWAAYVYLRVAGATGRY